MFVFITQGRRYFFWDKRRDKLGSLVVIERRSNGFSFQYEGRQYVSSFTRAAGKLFYSEYDVPQYKRELARMREEQERQRAEEIARRDRAEGNYNYRPSSDVMIVYGD